MYAFLLIFHSWFRWLAFAGVLFVFFRELRASTKTVPWTKSNVTWMKAAAFTFTAQVAVGILLFATSPYIHDLLNTMQTTMHDRTARFFVVEHGITMLLALGATHMAGAIAKKGASDRAKHRRAAIFFGIAGLLMVYAIPWWRPLLRMGM